MRLIDADDLIIEILTHDLIGDDKEVDKIILGAPTVKAIPIEWIKKHYGWLTMANEIIKDWEKHESRDTESTK